MADPQLNEPKYDELEFEIVMPPRGQSRARHRTVETKDGKRFGMAYKAKDQANDEKTMRVLMLEHHPLVPLCGPIWLSITAVMPMPKTGKSIAWRTAAKEQKIFPLGRPDLDNICKNFSDVAKGIFWHDDTQVVSISAGKVYGEVPKYVVMIAYRKDMQPSAGNYEILLGEADPDRDFFD